MEKKKGKEGAFQRWHGGESSVQAKWRAETTTSLPSFTFCLEAASSSFLIGILF